ncbi:MAG TPA: hypothetical protein VK604_25745 [Bryobacteraceae bacterium]|nr:hypothetical protein [Bryobacteraceae bacterium]
MDQNTLVTVFIGICALSMMGTAVAMIGIFFVARDIRGKVMQAWPELQSILASSKRTVERAEKHIETVGATSVSILEITKQQIVKVDELLSDASTRAKVQMERAELVLDDTMTRVQETVDVVQKGVLRPVREVHGILAGIRTAIAYLGRASRSTVERATSDEEMFI